jgi:imidazolonepropionase-like amidohydrolase
LGDASGTIREGEPADLVLVDANPLDDIGHTRRIRGVLMRGRWLDRDALDGLLDAAEARYR